MKTKEQKVCKECKGKGIVYEKFGYVHTCWKCLKEGRLTQ